MADRISTLVLFGATGDLARRMLLPSLYGLDSDGLLPDELRIIGTARTELDDAAFRERANEALQGASAGGFLQRGNRRALPVAASLCRRSTSPIPNGFAKLAEAIGDPCHGVAIFLSTAPSLFKPTIDGLAAAGPCLPDRPHGARKAARHRPRIAAARSTTRSPPHFPEDRTFRIDHYLGKETVQNLHRAAVRQL